MKKITAWRKRKLTLDKSGIVLDDQYIHNHIEVGWVKGSKPMPFRSEYTNQVSWQKSEWNKEFMYLVDDKCLAKS